MPLSPSAQPKESITSQVMNMFNKYTFSKNSSSNQAEKQLNIEQVNDLNAKLSRKFSFLTKSATTGSSSTLETMKTNKTCPANIAKKGFDRNKSQEITDTEYESEMEMERDFEPITMRRGPLLLKSRNNNVIRQDSSVNYHFNESEPVRRGPLILDSNLPNTYNNNPANTNINTNNKNNNINNNYNNYNNYTNGNTVNNNHTTNIDNVNLNYNNPVNQNNLQQKIPTHNNNNYSNYNNNSNNNNNEVTQSKNSDYLNHLEYLQIQNNNKINEIKQKTCYYNRQLDDVYNDVPLDITELLKLNAEAEAAEALRLDLEEKIRQEHLLEKQRQAAEAARKRADEWNVYKAASKSRIHLNNTITPDEFKYTREKLIDYYDNIEEKEDSISIGGISNVSTVSALQAVEIMRKVAPIVNADAGSIIKKTKRTPSNKKNKEEIMKMRTAPAEEEPPAFISHENFHSDNTQNNTIITPNFVEITTEPAYYDTQNYVENSQNVLFNNNNIQILLNNYNMNNVDIPKLVLILILIE